MFSGIVQGLCPIISLKKTKSLLSLTIDLGAERVTGLQTGASVAVNGVCLTVTGVDGSLASFDVIQETLERTTLAALAVGDLVNIERSLRMGDEIGGHIVSGHVMGKGSILSVVAEGDRSILTIGVPADWLDYILEKGFIALDGASLTVVSPQSDRFSVHLIPETRQRTTLGRKQVGDWVNVEIDAQTQAIVSTVQRYLASRGLSGGSRTQIESAGSFPQDQLS